MLVLKVMPHEMLQIKNTQTGEELIIKIRKSYNNVGSEQTHYCIEAPRHYHVHRIEKTYVNNSIPAEPEHTESVILPDGTRAVVIRQPEI